jgi:hypothetical protein
MEFQHLYHTPLPEFTIALYPMGKDGRAGRSKGGKMADQALKEIYAVGRRPFLVAQGILLEGLCHSGKPVSGVGVGHDKDAMVGPVLVEELDGEPDEVVAVARHHAALLGSGAFELFGVACLSSSR